MRIIGLCGGSGSGKGAVSECLSACGIPCIDLDKVYHELISTKTTCLEEIVSEFGDSIVSVSGTLDRKALAAIVFCGYGCESRLARLNEITHKHVIAEAERIISDLASRGCDCVAVDAPLLFESGYDKRCDLTVAVVADRGLRIERIASRDGISAEQAENRINSQIADAELVERADYVIYNNGSKEELSASVGELLNKIKTELEI